MAASKQNTMVRCKHMLYTVWVWSKLLVTEVVLILHIPVGVAASRAARDDQEGDAHGRWHIEGFDNNET
eukprot:scaffold4118_cov39-Attheya_sp.AAC.2